MKVKIYLKDGTEPTIYDLSVEEFQQLARDYEQYLKNGTPQSGIYDHHVDGKNRHKQTLFLDFKTIASIG